MADFSYCTNRGKRDIVNAVFAPTVRKGGRHERPPYGDSPIQWIFIGGAKRGLVRKKAGSNRHTEIKPKTQRKVISNL